MAPFEQQVTFLYVADLNRSTTFYGEQLGLPLVLDQGTCRIFRMSKSAFIGVCECADGALNSSIILTFVTEDVEGTYERLLKEGIEIEKSPQYNERYHITHFFLRDPDGYLLEVQKFHDPAWPAP